MQLTEMGNAPGGGGLGKMVNLSNRYMLRTEPDTVVGIGHVSTTHRASCVGAKEMPESIFFVI